MIWPELRYQSKMWRTHSFPREISSLCPCPPVTFTLILVVTVPVCSCSQKGKFSFFLFFKERKNDFHLHVLKNCVLTPKAPEIYYIRLCVNVNSKKCALFLKSLKCIPVNRMKVHLRIYEKDRHFEDYGWKKCTYYSLQTNPKYRTSRRLHYFSTQLRKSACNREGLQKNGVPFRRVWVARNKR